MLPEPANSQVCDEELTIDGLCNLIVALEEAAGVSACCRAVKPWIWAPSLSLIKVKPLPIPSSSVIVAEKGGPTVTASTASMKNSFSGSRFLYPSTFTRT